ncbi:hypothetical protein EMIHUDRAFT_207436 [Emiliania huxleyi CCMP1516]|uniref:Phospholipid scramblase n=2 Tax=Emiliania huxleyi TaxID=2903 RepID=A0A0D3JFG9_EMIH1|nr:hypothetical protein EMIHUDRAFT_207436 [Emiliania huxleyi CCMP1516]EOD22254.1 hypothetical protein EMIHUDRAFT_207436 [Emiliania huxleyi CCMP1516]|eukprot:XP_005774683.1 hypothetical protein EMIHUDRAFT_207436 [Emiliania huxleyi CCMP1516]
MPSLHLSPLGFGWQREAKAKGSRMDTVTKEGGALFSACICCINEMDTTDILILCKGAQEFLCIEEKVCLAADTEHFPIGLIKEDGMICKVGLPCCTCGLKVPEVLIKGEGQCLCCKNKASFPFVEEYVAKPVCAICFIALIPNFGICKPFKEVMGAPEIAEMER